MGTPSEDHAGGARRGATPPASAQTSATKNRDPAAGHNLTPRTILGLAAVALFVALFFVVAVLMVIQM